jgi:microcompartment protein PduB
MTMKDDLMGKIMGEVMKKIGDESAIADIESKPASKASCSMTEFVGKSDFGKTIGLVIANVDSSLHELMGIDKKFRSIGIIGARTGAGPQIFAADEAVKATNSEIVKIELPRDTEGGAGHGSLIIFGAEDVSDARRAVEVTLKELERTFGDVYGNEAGHLELQYSARASYALNKAFNAPIGKAFGISVGAPAAIGVVMADAAVKAANVDIIGYASPGNGGTSFTNEVIVFLSGDSGAVRQSVIAAREAGLPLIETLGGEAKPASVPYI